MTDPIAELEELLRHRETLNKSNAYFYGASERDPNFTGEDQREWDELIVEMRAASSRLRALGRTLRENHPERFAAWVAVRRESHEAELGDPDLPEWKRKHLNETIARWARFLKEDFDDFTRWVSW